MFWQAFSLPIAYTTANAYLNLNNYTSQFNNLFCTNFPTITENPTIALALFLIMLIIPNLYVFLSLYSLKIDLINGRLKRDIRITLHKNHIEISGKNFTVTDTLDRQIVEFTLLSTVFPFIVDYRSLALVLLYVATLTLIGVMYLGGSVILLNPYLRLRYQAFILQNDSVTLYIIMEKEKEFERPKFSDYIVDWFYDHTILIGFKDGQKQVVKNKVEKVDY